VYAYLALGDAYEKIQDQRQALAVYKELMGLGVKVHGLKEKINHFETLLAQKERADAVRLAKQNKTNQQNLFTASP